MDPDLIHQTEGCKMALFVRNLVGKTLWVFSTSSGSNLEQRFYLNRLRSLVARMRKHRAQRSGEYEAVR